METSGLRGSRHLKTKKKSIRNNFNGKVSSQTLVSHRNDRNNVIGNLVKTKDWTFSLEKKESKEKEK